MAIDSDEKREIIAAIVDLGRTLRGEMVTVGTDLRGEIRASEERLRAEMGGLRDELREDISASEGRIRGELVAFKDQVREDFAGVHRSIASLRRTIFEDIPQLEDRVKDLERWKAEIDAVKKRAKG